MGTGSGRKIFSIRRPVLFPERVDERAERAREVATGLLAGELAARATFDRSLEGLLPSAASECTPERIAFTADPKSLPTLPTGYFFKGGAARLALGVALGTHAPLPRDIDVVRFGRGWNETDTHISKTVMPLDFERGFGVEVCTDIGRYLATRDLSVNEVLAGQGMVIASPIAVLDTLGGLLRPCKYRPGSIRRPPSLGSGTVVKMLRLRAEGVVDGYPWSLVGIPADQVIEPFDVAVQLDKAFARSPRVAEVFIEQCVTVGIFPPAVDSVTTFLRSIGEIIAAVYEPERFFRHLPAETLAAERASVR